MKVTPQLQNLSRYITEPSLNPLAAIGDSGSEDAAFQDVLDARLAAGQRVITAEEIIADLDGTPTFGYKGFSAGTLTDRGQGEATQNSASVRSITDTIETIAKKYGVDTDLVKEVVRAESNFNPNAVSRAGAKGLMQLMDSTARSMHVRNVYDPVQNLEGGTKYLRSLLQRFDGNVKVALAAYNAGPGRIRQLGIDDDEELEEKAYLLPEETRRYVAKITSRLDQQG
ncbi:lytic transglycosylase domain-containing protein [Brevibacillus fulvus]|uniref:Transglycosylase SLT domain-containing protein n=1 Tax=Brevibacillus fulvus TaxID=1125967 RepID=A0A938XXD2_9BACL|nr:lytic transglycosylase domain-containing protein [Brevibacillus fulvus]MBM7588704.1 hypothetical protein [Brevibacillus fulvus]